jgi:hypothetical protein
VFGFGQDDDILPKDAKLALILNSKVSNIILTIVGGPLDSRTMQVGIKTAWQWTFQAQHTVSRTRIAQLL